MNENAAARQLCLTIFQLQRQLLNKVNLRLSCHGISMTELTVLLRLSQSPHLSLSRIELAGSVGLSASGVTRLLAPMEKIGLVDKQANGRDARVSLVKLTQTGQQILSEAMQTFAEFANSTTQSMSQEQIGQGLQLLALIDIGKDNLLI